MRRKNFFTTVLIAICTQIAILLLAVPLLAKAMPLLNAAAPQSGAPAWITYQGYLSDANGPLNQPTDLWVGIYASQASASPLWQQEFADVALSQGYFTLQLPLNAANFDSAERWIRVAIQEGETYTYMPFQRFTSVPYALQAANADLLDGQDASALNTAYGCRYISTATQSIPSDASTPLTFNMEIIDTTPGKNCFDANYPTRLYARVAGCYLAGGGFGVDGSSIPAEQILAVMVRQNGSTYLGNGELTTVPGQHVALSVTSGMIYMAAGEYIEIAAYHRMGSAIELLAANAATSQGLHYGWLMRVGSCTMPEPR